MGVRDEVSWERLSGREAAAQPHSLITLVANSTIAQRTWGCPLKDRFESANAATVKIDGLCILQ